MAAIRVGERALNSYSGFMFRKISAIFGLFVCASLSGVSVGAQQPTAYSLTGAYWATHDPSIMKQGKTWYVFSTGKAPTGGQFAIRCSEDLRLWRLCGQVFDKIPDWITRESPDTKELWAPDISYFNGVYRLYYAYSLFGKNTSGIALATNKTLDPASPDYKWVDQGLVLRSRTQDDFNAIDPNFAVDAKGGTWLAFGSFWSGIKLVNLDPQTGKPSDSTFYSLAARKPPVNPPPEKPDLPPDWQAVEAPFIVRHGHYYYLFVSWDLCCRGTKSTYRIMVGRSSEITGPYVDEDGEIMRDGGGSPVLTGNARWFGPGGQSVLLGHGKDPDILVFHAYAETTGKPALQVSTLTWEDGWPYAALGEK
jgi:arabinan endo-1,5-alpha-L-arabinosidase